jgi:hypothetical protein
MRGASWGLMTMALLLIGVQPARADATAFVGATTTPDARMARGFSIGAGLLVVGFEGEYANTPDDEAKGIPSLRTFSGNGLLQTPFMIVGFQPYFTVGGGVYRETLGSRSETGFTGNVGGGVKIALAGPLRLRLDYRRFGLGSDALYAPAHRFYGGLNLKF